MNQSQRTVVVVAAGLAIAVVVTAINRSVWGVEADGWFNYAPNSTVVVPVDASTVWLEAVTWIIGIAGWLAVAFVVYRRPRRPS